MQLLVDTGWVAGTYCLCLSLHSKASKDPVAGQLWKTLWCKQIKLPLRMANYFVQREGRKLLGNVYLDLVKALFVGERYDLR